MNEIKKKIELLAPAKNKECAFAAINAGADAVYLGPESFGARKKAGNSLEDIEEIVEYAHKFLVKVYVTVNTILYDNELTEVEKLIWKLYEIGVDAIIFQDLSFFEMDLPPIALHASTQCNNDELAKIKFLEGLNVQRVVLPREFSLNEIKNVVKACDIETEVFIHGALCVSYSGQCYFSDHIGGRSANRGDCAQPCRKKYSLRDEKNDVILKSQYLLSMKDFSLSSHIKELMDSGVTSLKIEGRLKDKEYVTNVVSFYRQQIDKISDELKASVGDIKTDFIPNVDKTFNRGYTNFYFDEKRTTFINPETPKFRGQKLGKVLSVNGKRLKTDFGIKLNVADKITYFDSNNELTGTTVTIVSADGFEVLKIGSIKQGTVLYRNFDSEFDKSLQNAEFKRKIPIDIVVDNEKVSLKSFGRNEITYYFSETSEIANNTAKAKENIVKQLSKLGETEFFASNVSVSDDFNLFMPVSVINDIRRNVVELLQAKSKSNYDFQRRNTKFEPPNHPYAALDYSFNVSNASAKTFYEKCGCEVKELSPECKKKEKSITLMKTKHCLRDFAGICLKNSKDKRKLYLLDEYGVKYPLAFDCKNCLMFINSIEK